MMFSKKSLIERLCDAVVIGVVTTLMMGFMFIWLTSDSESDIDEGMSVTIEYDCREAVLQPDEFPSEVVNECRDKFRFMKDNSKPTV